MKQKFALSPCPVSSLCWLVSRSSLRERHLSAYVGTWLFASAASAADAGPCISAGGGGGGLGQCDALASASLTTPALEHPRSQTSASSSSPAFSASFELDELGRRTSAHPEVGGVRGCVEALPRRRRRMCRFVVFSAFFPGDVRRRMLGYPVWVGSPSSL